MGEERGLDVVICTADKDARQLLTDHIRILNLRKNALMDAAALEQEWGIRPDQVVDYLALTGDSVDNVPGAQGIGPKTAAQLLQMYGTLDNLMAHLDEIKGTFGHEVLAYVPEMERDVTGLGMIERLARRLFEEGS